MQVPPSFFEEFILDVLRNANVTMTEDMKKEYVPQFIAEAEQRLGAALLPLLSEDGQVELISFMKDSSVTTEQWVQFWKKHVVNFEEVVQHTLDAFAQELRAVL
jgi:hypothetical protein